MTAIEIPDGMINEINKIRESYPELAYEDPAEFIREAIREKFIRTDGSGIVLSGDIP